MLSDSANKNIFPDGYDDLYFDTSNLRRKYEGHLKYESWKPRWYHALWLSLLLNGRQRFFEQCHRSSSIHQHKLLHRSDNIEPKLTSKRRLLHRNNHDQTCQLYEHHRPADNQHLDQPLPSNKHHALDDSGQCNLYKPVWHCFGSLYFPNLHPSSSMQLCFNIHYSSKRCNAISLSVLYLHLN